MDSSTCNCSKRSWHCTWRPWLHDIHARWRSCHQSKLATEFLKKNYISVLEWPGNSPVLNPVENQWTIMKDKVTYKQPSSAENLRQAIKDVWVTDITQEYYESQVFRIPRRIQAVTDSKGGHTKYWKVVTLTLLDAIKCQIVLFYDFGEINLYNLVWRPPKSVLSILFLSRVYWDLSVVFRCTYLVLVYF